MDIMFWALIGAVIALVFAAVAASGVLKKSEGSEKIKKNCRCHQAGRERLPETPV